MKRMFKKPKWLRPEVNEFKYWVHLIMLASVVLGLLELLYGGGMFSIKNVLVSVPLLAAGDIVAHTVLKMD